MRYTGDDYATPPDGFYDPSLWDTLVRLWYSGGLLWMIGIAFCVLMLIAGLIVGARRRTGLPPALNRNVDALGAVIGDAVRGSAADVRDKSHAAIDANQDVFGHTSELMDLIGKHHAALNKANSAVKEVEPDKKPEAAKGGVSGMSGGTVINIAVNNGQPGVAEPGATAAPGAVAAVGGEVVGLPKAEETKAAKPGFDTTTKVWLALQKLAAPWRDLGLMREHYAAVFRQLTTAEWRDPRTLYGGGEPGAEATRPRWQR
ncbi:hypothetical protein [Asticcacaulis sp.]|uniref:hypothetical protein n=1 Tax=Asticcacaulis sp. TaxID=1872648 RepID=UPI00262C8AA0|nr:hypothetical protein [Asticcacaulis sp.]